MRKFKGVKRTSLFVSLSLIITFAFLVNADLTRAQTFDSMLLLEGQSASSGTSSVQPASFHTILITSIGNRVLSATISGPSSGFGIAWIMLYGTGGKNYFDYNYGPVSNSGIKAIIDIGKDVSFGVIIGGIILTSPVSAEAPARYSFSIGH